MDGTNLDFAGEMLSAFGDDRFYQAMDRAGWSVYSRSLFKALGGDDRAWDRAKVELRLKGDSLMVAHLPEEGDMREILCEVAFTISQNHKEFALRSPRLPASIHARMMLDSQNIWTRKYAENIELKEAGG